MLVTLEQAKSHLRIDTNAGDPDLTLMIEGASGAILNHLQGGNRFVQEVDGQGSPVFDEDGGPVYTDVVLPEVKSATLLLVGYLNKDRDTDKDHEYEYGVLPRPVTALLAMLRKPTLV